jgi:predicted nuclease of predicted toxin-antitoxin system
MKIKLDENIPASLSTRLAALGHDVDSVPEEGLTGYPDTAVWSEAQAGGRFLVTQDLDFSDIRRFSPGAQGKWMSRGLPPAVCRGLIPERVLDR